MVLFSLIKILAVGIFVVYLGAFICTLSPCFRRYGSIDTKPAPEFFGPLTRNTILDNAERLYENKIGFGPESIAIKNGVLYTGVNDGRVLKITNGKIETLANLGTKDCVPWMRANNEEEKCAYPLGMRFDSAGNLVVVDMIKGLYKVNANTGSITYLIKAGTPVEGVKLGLANDLDIAKNGDVYFSEFSSDWKLDTPFWMERLKSKPSGRILRYNAKTEKVEVVLDSLHSPNGIQLSPKEDFLVFSQAFLHRVAKYHLTGLKKGQLEIFLDNVPGSPDNIRPSGRGTYWLGLYTARIPNEPSLWERLESCQLSQYIVFGALETTCWMFKTVGSLVQLSFVDNLHSMMREVIDNNVYQANYGLVLEFTMDGDIVRSLHSPKGVLNKISQVTEYEGTLYFASPFNSFIGKIKLN